MSLAVYNILLTLLMVVALPFAVVALMLRPRYRLGLGQRLGRLPPDLIRLTQGTAPFWLHAPSVGELLATRPFLAALKGRFPDTPLVVSVQTTTAYHTATERCPEADGVFYFPLDYPLVSRRVLKRIGPQVFFFTETEMWPNILAGLARRHIPALLVSGRFSRRARRRYGLLSPVFRPILQSITACCMQTQEDAQRLIAAGADARRVQVTGNFKVDGVHGSGEAGKAILAQAGLDDRPLLIGASTHESEEAVLLQAVRQLRSSLPRLLLLLAPRHPERFSQVEAVLQQQGWRYVKRSAGAVPAPPDTEVFLLDTLGELAGFYAAASLVFVGGSLIRGPGGHSMIEPALAGVPVCFGPYAHNFSSIAAELEKAQGGIEIHDAHSLCNAALPLLTDANLRQQTGARARKTIEQQQGAVERTVGVVLQHCPPRAPSQP